MMTAFVFCVGLAGIAFGWFACALRSWELESTGKCAECTRRRFHSVKQRTDGRKEPLKRLHELSSKARHHHEVLDAMADECVLICGYQHAPGSVGSDAARSIVEHGVPVREVLDELFSNG